MNTKTLVVYFSCTGTTKLLAEYAAEILEADLYEITARDPYTEADLAYYTNGRADREQNDPSFLYFPQQWYGLQRGRSSGLMFGFDILDGREKVWFGNHKRSVGGMAGKYQV